VKRHPVTGDESPESIRGWFDLVVRNITEDALYVGCSGSEEDVP